jgi:hypothetical protein
MSEETLTQELSDQGVIHVKRFTVKTSSGVSKTNTYLMTFSSASLPRDIKAGYHNIKVEVYIPNPLRCYKCQRYGHGATRCTNGHICHRCGSDEHEGFDCKEAHFCSNCKGSHMASSKECPIWIRESAICKLKVENNISFPEARKLFFSQNKSTTSTSNTYAAVAKATRPVANVACQTNLTWIGSSIPMTRPSFTLSTLPITTKKHSSCQTTPASDTSLPSSDAPSQQTVQTAKSANSFPTLVDPFLPILKPVSESSSKSSTPSQPPLTPSKSSLSIAKSSSPTSQRSKGKTKKAAKAQSGRPHKGEDDPIQSFNRYSSLDEMDVDPSPTTSRPVSLSPRRGRRRSPVKHPS